MGLNLIFSSHPLNTFLTNAPILYPVKPPESQKSQNQRFSGILRGYKMGAFARNGLNFLSNYFFTPRKMTIKRIN